MNLLAGVWVDHPTLGEGLVVAVDGHNGDQSAEVDFYGVRKKLLVRYSGLQVLDREPVQPQELPAAAPVTAHGSIRELARSLDISEEHWRLLALGDGSCTKVSEVSARHAAVLANPMLEQVRAVYRQPSLEAMSALTAQLQAQADAHLSTAQIARRIERERKDAARRERQVNSDLQRAQARIARDEAVAGMRIVERTRPVAPVRAVLHLGPTNSGKTHQAVDEMARAFERQREDSADFIPAGSYAYAAPLRMLAQENYERLVVRLGLESVGLVTGEESINEDAPVLSVTTEMVPSAGIFLVVDEAHWLADNSRGPAWTNALLSAHFEQIHAAGVLDAEPLLRRLLADANDLQVIHHERKSTLRYGGVLRSKIPARSAVVVFSKRAVYVNAYRLRAAGHSVAIIYGALPPGTRRAQLQRFISGEADVIVCTDVIGHGINLPLDNVVFAETTKFDGRARRDLQVWELAQIAGRAGRFGLSGDGTVYATESADPALVAQGVAAAIDGDSDLDLRSPYISPRLGELAGANAKTLPYWLDIWRRAVPQQGMRPVSTGEYSTRLGWLKAAGVLSAETDMAALWKVLRMPVEDEAVVVAVGFAVLMGQRSRFEQMILRACGPLGSNLTGLEQRSARIRDLRSAVISCELGQVAAQSLAAAEERVSIELSKRLLQEVTSGTSRCACGEWIAPWDQECSSCSRWDW